MDFEFKAQGFIYTLFQYLQITDPLTKEKPNINIPETISIRLGLPIVWIYSRNGEVLKKNKNKLSLSTIKERFLNSKDERQIQAIWIYPSSDSHYYFDYFTHKQLLDFLDNHITYDTNGYLQKFIYPKSNHNQVIKSIWSNNLSLFEGYQNKHNIYENKADILQRVVTFENPNGPVEQFTVKGKVLPQKLEQLQFIIQKHISNITNDQRKIIFMENYFKIAANGDIYFLFCSHLQQRNQQNTKMRPVLQLPYYVSLNLLNFYKPIHFSDTMVCVGCEQEKNKIQFYHIEMNQIINGWEYDHWNNEDAQKQFKKIKSKHNLGDIIQSPQQNKIKKNISNKHQIKMLNNYQIPSLIRKLYPKLNEKSYEKVKENNAFLHEQIKLCEDCYNEKIKNCRMEETLTGLTELYKRNQRENIEVELKQNKQKSGKQEIKMRNASSNKILKQSKSQLLYRQSYNNVSNILKKYEEEEQSNINNQYVKTEVSPRRKEMFFNPNKYYIKPNSKVQSTKNQRPFLSTQLSTSNFQQQ